MKNKVVIITGASSGIGKSLAEVFGNQGSKIVITGRNESKLNVVKDGLISNNIDVLSIVADVSIEEDNIRMANEVIQHFGKIDVLINNAGISMRALFDDLDVSVIKNVMDINFYGTVYATKYCLPEIIKTKAQ